MSAKNAPEMTPAEQAFCSHLRVGYAANIDSDGVTHGWWECEACHTRFAPASAFPRWVSVEEGLPEKEGLYWGVVSYVDGGQKRSFTEDVWYDPEEERFLTLSVTHWLKNVPPIPNTEER